MKETYEEEVKSLWRIFKLISKAEKPEQIASGISREATKILDGDSAFFWLFGEKDLNLVEEYKLSREYKSKISLKAEEEFIKKNIKIDQTFSSSNIEKDSWILFPEILKSEGIASCICAPVSIGNKLLGILAVFTKKSKTWTKRENRIIKLLAEQSAYILEKAKQLKHLKENSIRDGLTGLYSRLYFLARAREEIAKYPRKNEYVSVLFCDLDKFKDYNRIEGYAEGDRLLCLTAKSINSSLRKGDTLCRYGGDEFTVLLPNTNPFQAVKIAKRIHKTFLKTINAERCSLAINMCIGIATYPIHGSSIEDIIAKADQTTTFAKRGSTGKKIFVWNEWKVKSDISKFFEKDLIPEVIYALAEVVNIKNGYPSEHSKLVSERASRLAKKIRLGAKSIRTIKTASLLYDIGKLIAPGHILNKPAPLNQEEWEIIKRIAENSVRIIRYIKGLENVIPVVREIREKWDGKGYPDGLSGEQISLEARVIALADAYQALISTRPYRKKLSKEEAIKKLQEEAGKKFDPKLVQEFIKTLP